MAKTIKATASHPTHCARKTRLIQKKVLLIQSKTLAKIPERMGCGAGCHVLLR
jgi:hypothetical protein